MQGSRRVASMVAIFRLTIAGGGGDADNFRKYAAELVAIAAFAQVPRGGLIVTGSARRFYRRSQRGDRVPVGRRPSTAR
jgi:hypothetical protein